jgi:tetratricopeptide (TPR) repeat protein
MQAERKKRAEPVDDDNDMVRLVKVSKSPLKINPLLTSGFENFNRGNFAAAKTDYESVLKSEPQNTEALHGLAAIALREGRTSLADYYYERILVADPKDAAALSAMINLHRQNDPTTAESRLQARRARILRWEISTLLKSAGVMRSRPISKLILQTPTIRIFFTTWR